MEIKIDGMVIVCDNPVDAAAFVRELQQTKPLARAQQNLAATNGKPPSKSLRAVLDELNNGAKNMLRAVLNAPENTLSAKMLAEKLGIAGSGLGGTRASFSKYMKAHRYNASEYLHVTGGPGEKVYKVPQEKVAELRSALHL